MNQGQKNIRDTEGDVKITWCEDLGYALRLGFTYMYDQEVLGGSVNLPLLLC